MDFEPNSEQQMLIDQVRRYVREEIIPLEAKLDPDAAEAAIVLRRACEIGMGRGMDLEAVDSAEELGPMMGAVCYTMQPSVMPVAFRNRGSIRDFARHPDALLHDQ